MVKSCLETGTVIYCSTHDMASVYTGDRGTDRGGGGGSGRQISSLNADPILSPAHNLIKCL